MSQEKKTVAISYGDGIGPEIMQAALYVLQQAGADFNYEPVEIGEKVYLKGNQAGIEEKTWNVIKGAKAFLKAPVTTPQGGGFKSLNVKIRTTLGLFANIRPCVSYDPFIKTKHPKMDVVIVRENEEDLYAGIEYKQTPCVCHSIKLISRQGCEKIIRSAFEYARHQRRKKVSCFTKDNIMKFSDGLFHQVFEEIAQEYPDLEHEHWIVDIGAAKLADTPESFDVIVLPNLYGDILSDVAAQISGSVGIGGSANIGVHGAMFEAIHGSAPKRAGQNVANPSGLILASVLMLNYLNEPRLAEKIHNAWLKTIEEGIHTYDIFVEGESKEKVGTKQFAEAVVRFLGQKPRVLAPVCYRALEKFPFFSSDSVYCGLRFLKGVDVYLYFSGSAQEFLKKAQYFPRGVLRNVSIANRGVQVWPEGHLETFCIEQWRCRFLAEDANRAVEQKEVVVLLQHLIDQGFDVIKTEHLYQIDNSLGYSSI